MEISIDEILDEEFIKDMKSETIYNQKLKLIYDLPYVEFLDFIKSIIAATDKTGQMKMIEYFISNVDNFSLYEQVIPGFVLKQASLEIFRFYLRDKRYGDAFIKYVGHLKILEYLEERIFFSTYVRKMKVKNLWERLSYIKALVDVSIFGKLKLSKQYFRFYLPGIIHANELGNCLEKSFFNTAQITINVKKISSAYKNYDQIQWMYLYTLYHEIGHIIQRRNIGNLFQYRNYRLQKEYELKAFNRNFYDQYHDYFEQEITSDLIAFEFLQQDSIYTRESDIDYVNLNQNIKLDRISKEYILVDRKMTELLEKNPKLKIYQVEYKENHQLKSVPELVQDKREKNFQLGNMNVDYVNLYAHLIMNRLDLLNCEQFLDEIQTYSMIELTEVVNAIDYIMEEVLELLNFLDDLFVKFSKIEELVNKVTEKRKLLSEYRQELYRKKEIVDFIRKQKDHQLVKTSVLKIW